MRPRSNSLAQTRPDPFIRTRDDPYFDGIRRDDANKATMFEFQEKVTSNNVSRSVSDFSETDSRKTGTDISKKVAFSPSIESPSDIILEPLGRSFPENCSKNSRATSFQFPNIMSDLRIEFEEENDPIKEPNSNTRACEIHKEYATLTGLSGPAMERAYNVNKRKIDLSRIPLPPSAASFYSGYSPKLEIVELHESINRLNSYLKARREDVNAGVPGRFLHAVLGQDVSDVGSVASTIMYAFYLSETLEGDQLCTVPIINMKRADLNSHAELKWLLDSCYIDQSSLIFVDEIDLSYYDIYGSLKLILLNGNKLPAKQEALKDALVEIFNCRKDDPAYPWVDIVTVGQEHSCCTLIAEKFVMTSPEILAGQGLSRLLLAGILLDTGNLSNPHCTPKDMYMATLLINGAGRFGLDGLYQILRYKMYDVSDLKVGDILLKDFKKWTRIGKLDDGGSRLMVSHIGMSSIGISVEQLLAHEDSSTQEIIHFQQFEKLRLLMVVSGYHDTQKNFKREILVSAESIELLKNLLHFFNSSASQLPLKVLHHPGLRDEMRAFEIDKVTSRKTIEQVLEEFSGTTKR